MAGSTDISAGRIAHVWYPSTGAGRSLDPTIITTQPETPHARGTLGSNLLRETSGSRPSHSADHNGGLICSGERGPAPLCASKWPRWKKERKKEKKPTPPFPGSGGGQHRVLK